MEELATFQRRFWSMISCLLSCLLTQKVRDGLEGLLLAHNKANFLFCVVSHELGVANAAFLPLFIAPSEELGSDFHQAHQVLFA